MVCSSYDLVSDTIAQHQSEREVEKKGQPFYDRLVFQNHSLIARRRRRKKQQLNTRDV
jgi:hypothetical protein